MRLHSAGINGYNASLVGRFGVGDVGRYGFALGATETCFQYNDDGSCASTTSDGGATVTSCTTTTGDTVASSACGSMGPVNPYNTIAQVLPSPVGTPSTTTAAIWLGVAALVILMIK
jgi:hypothetical protein